jgi:hypothetical protein
MIEYTITPTNEGLLVQIYDAPAGGRRILFVERNGQIDKYVPEAVVDMDETGRL